MLLSPSIVMPQSMEMLIGSGLSCFTFGYGRALGFVIADVDVQHAQAVTSASLPFACDREAGFVVASLRIICCRRNSAVSSIPTNVVARRAPNAAVSTATVLWLPLMWVSAFRRMACDWFAGVLLETDVF